MTLNTNERRFPYPAKTESFDNSWNTFQEFFNLLDREFSSFFNFTLGTGIKFLWKTENEFLLEKTMKAGDFGVRMDIGAVYEYRNYGMADEINGWKFKYDVNSLPLNVDRDPGNDDWGHPVGFNWINRKSGESFYCVKNEIGESIWVSEDRAIGYTVRTGYFVQPMNLEFVGAHFSGMFEKSGRFYYTVGETSMKVMFGAKEFGRIKLDQFKTYYGLADLDILEYPVGDENYGKCNSDLFLRLLTFINNFCVAASPFYFEKKNLNLSATVLEIISTQQTLDNEFTRFGLTIPTLQEIQEYKYDFYHYITYMEQVNNTRKKELIRCMACEGLDSYDGNLVFVEGNLVYADGNELPPCA